MFTAEDARHLATYGHCFDIMMRGMFNRIEDAAKRQELECILDAPTESYGEKAAIQLTKSGFVVSDYIVYSNGAVRFKVSY